MSELAKKLSIPLEQFHSYLKNIDIRRSSYIFLISGFLAGALIGLIESINVVVTSDMGLDIGVLFLYITFSFSASIIQGLFIAIIEFVLVVIIINIIFGLLYLFKRQNYNYPLNLITFFSVIIALLQIFFLNTIFKSINEDFIYPYIKKLADADVFNMLFIIIFVTFIYYSYRIIIYYIKKTPTVQYNFSFNKALAIIIPVSVLIIMIFIFNNGLNLNELSLIMKESSISFFNFIFSGLYKLWQANNMAFMLICFLISLLFSILLISLLAILTCKISIKLKIPVAFTLILAALLYLLSRNYFTNQLFINAGVSMILFTAIFFTFLTLQLSIYRLFKEKMIFNLNYNKHKTFIITAILIYLISGVIGLFGFNQFDSIRALVFRKAPILSSFAGLYCFANYYNKFRIIPVTISKNVHISQKTVNTKSSHHIFLITIDALRYDIFQAFLKEHKRNFNTFTEDAYNFNNAFSASAHTASSMSSIFTSKYLASNADIKLATLPEILKAHNYFPASFTFLESHNDILQIKGKEYESLLIRGFEHSSKVNEDITGIDSGKFLNKNFFEFMNSYKLDKPLFIWLHYPELHFASTSTAFKNFSSRQEFLDRYKSSLLLEDKIFGELIDYLKQHGYYDNSLIILTSDHGEGGKEHGQFFHSYNLYQEFIKVPLYIKLPKNSRTKNFDNPFSLVDITPTILDYTSVETESYSLQGRSLLSVIDNKDIQKRPVISVITLFRDKNLPFYNLYGSADFYNKVIIEATVIDETSTWKLINNMLFGFKELYNLKKDPTEQINLIDQKPQVAHKLASTLNRVLKESINKQTFLEKGIY